MLDLQPQIIKKGKQTLGYMSKINNIEDLTVLFEKNIYWNKYIFKFLVSRMFLLVQSKFQSELV